MDGLQPTFYSTGNPQINFGFRLINGPQELAFMFKCFDLDAFQPQNNFCKLVTQEILPSLSGPPDRADDAQLIIEESISTIGVVTRHRMQLRLDGFMFFDGWVDAMEGCPPAVLSGTWTRTF